MATNTPFTDTQEKSDRDGWMLAAGFFVFVLGSFTVLEIGLVPQSAELFVLGLLFIVLPLLLGLTNAVLGHAYSSSLAIGASPVVAWVIITVGRFFVGTIENSLVNLLVFAIVITAVGILAALGGFAVGYFGRVAAAKYAGTGS
jgi:hypothetical protein